jgi:hypothetical protein
MEPNLQSLADYQICSGDEINPKRPLPSHLPDNKLKKKKKKSPRMYSILDKKDKSNK